MFWLLIILWQTIPLFSGLKELPFFTACASGSWEGSARWFLLLLLECVDAVAARWHLGPESSGCLSWTLECPRRLIICLPLHWGWLEVPVQLGCCDDCVCLSCCTFRTSLFLCGLCKVSQLDNWLLIWWVKMQSRSCQAFLGHVPRIGTASFLLCSVSFRKSQASPELVPESFHKDMSQEAIFRAKLPQYINVVNYIN